MRVLFTKFFITSTTRAASALALLLIPGSMAAQTATSEADILAGAKGVTISKDTYKQYATAGNPGGSMAIDPTTSDKVFVIYNVGTGKFLVPGGYWGRHAALSTTPHRFWLQRHSDQKGAHKCYLRYPETEAEAPLVAAGESFLTYGWERMHIGSQEGNSRSHAIYKSAKIIKADGTEKRTLATSFEPKGDKFDWGQLTDFDPDNGDALVIEADLSQTTGTKEDIISIGSDITKWQDAGAYNLHTYFSLKSSKGTPKFYIDFTYNNQQQKAEKEITTQTFDLTSVTLRLDKEGYRINGELLVTASTLSTPGSGYKYSIPYNGDLAGEIVKFEYDTNKGYVTDEDGYLAIDQTDGRPLEIMHQQYVYADNPDDKYPHLFISQEILKQSGAFANEGKYLGFALYDTAMDGLSGTVGAYTDRNVDSYNSGRGARELGTWEFIPTGTEGEYYMAMNLHYALDGKTMTAEANKYYLRADGTYIYGDSDQKDTDGGKHYYYWQTDGKGNYTKIDQLENELTNADLTATAPTATDRNAVWKLLTVKDYIALLGQIQSELEDPIDITFMLTDPDMTSESAALRHWQTDATLTSTDKNYTGAKLRIGYDGYYKTSTQEQDYLHGTAYNYSNQYTDLGTHRVRINHTRYMCASIQNGGYGRFYQTVNVYRSGWYIVRCQGMSTTGAKLYATLDGKTTSVQLAQITSDEYTKLCATDAATTYWPYDVAMPMYNATVAMNDYHTDDGSTVERYTNQVLVFVDNQNESHPVQLTIGIDVPQGVTDADFTAFDSFRLLYGGMAAEPYLVLDEDDETLDHLDKTIHKYHSTPGDADGVHKKLLLHRTFSADRWNSIMLPVGLTQEQYQQAFGNAPLAELTRLTSTEVQFETVKAASAYGDGSIDATAYWLKPMTPYIIKPSSTEGTCTEAYKATLFTWESQGKQSIIKTMDKPHYEIDDIVMTEGIAPVATDADGNTHWDFANMKTADGYAYAMTGQEVGGNGTMTAYGMLTRNYTIDSAGKRQLIEGRAPMADSYTMSGNKLTYLKSGAAAKAFRCWFAYTAPKASEAAPTLYIDNISTPTGIADINASDEGIIPIQAMAKGIYTLNGQRISTSADQAGTLPKGIYIINGRKTIIK